MIKIRNDKDTTSEMIEYIIDKVRPFAQKLKTKQAAPKQAHMGSSEAKAV